MTNQEAIEQLKLCKGYPQAREMAIEALKQPTIIRCKDCKYIRQGKLKCLRGKASSYFCDYTSCSITKDDFCSHAERREE